MKQDYVTFEQALALKADVLDPPSHRSGEIRILSSYVGGKDSVSTKCYLWLQNGSDRLKSGLAGLLSERLSALKSFFDYSIVYFSSLDMNVRHHGGFNKFPIFGSALSDGITESLQLLGYA